LKETFRDMRRFRKRLYEKGNKIRVIRRALLH